MMIEIDKYTLDSLLGPDGRNAAVWLHGCDKNCKGCISSRNSGEPGYIFNTSFLASLLVSRKPDTVVISGGEPFRQPRALDELTRLIKEYTGGKTGLMIYTGLTYEKLAGSTETVKSILNRTDILVDGEYIQELDDGLPYRGSSNQRIIFLTDTYRNKLKEKERSVRMYIDEDSLVMDGIPSAGAAALWNKIREGVIV